MRFASISIVALPVVLATLSGCASGPATRTDKDPMADLGAYKTFAFFSPLTTDRMQYSTIDSRRLKQATREQLERRGYTYREEGPDLRVQLYLKVVERQEVRSSASPGFYGPRALAVASAGYRSVETVDYRQGTLTIDLVDTHRNALVWQGVAEGRLGNKTHDHPDQVVDDVVGRLFAGFPANGAK